MRLSIVGLVADMPEDAGKRRLSLGSSVTVTGVTDGARSFMLLGLNSTRGGMRMSRLLRFLVLSVTAAILAVPINASADREVRLSCSVAVDYVFRAQNGTVLVTEPYQRDFLVQPGVDFVDDFSTPTRFKLFTASVLLEPGPTVVAIDYFNDVGVFTSIDLSTTLTLLKGRLDGTTAGSHTFSTSLPSLNGHHTTSYTLTCSRA